MKWMVLVSGQAANRVTSVSAERSDMATHQAVLVG